MEFKDFLAYLKTIPLPVAYQEAIDTLKPYGSQLLTETVVFCIISILFSFSCIF